MTCSPTPQVRKSPRRVFACVLIPVAIGVLALMLPRFAGPFAAAWIEGACEECFEGSVSIGAAELAWTDRQVLSEVVLSTPDGERVAWATVELPSLFDLAFGEGRAIEVELDAKLIADDEGVTNLARALQPRLSHQDLCERLGDDQLELVLRGGDVTWSDAGTRARGETCEVRELLVELRLQPSEPTVLDLGATLHGVGQQDARPCVLAVHAAGNGKTGNGSPHGETGCLAAMLASVDAELTADHLPLSLVDTLAGLRGGLVEAFGERVDLDLALEHTTDNASTLSLHLQGDQTTFDLQGGIEDGVLRVEENLPVSAALHLPRTALSEALAPYLPHGSEIVADDSHGPASLEAHNLELDLATTYDRIAAGDWLGALRRLRGHVTFDMSNDLYHVDPRTQETGAILGFSGLHLELQADGEEGLKGGMFTSVDTGARGGVQLNFELNPPDLPDEPDLAFVKLEVGGISGDSVDAYLGLDGCFSESVGLFGFRLVADHITREAGELRLSVHSEGISGNVHAHIEEGVLLFAPEHGLNALFVLDPGWFERCIAREVGGWGLNLVLGMDEGLRFRTDGVSLPLPADRSPEALARALREGAGTSAFELGTWSFSRPRADGSDELFSFEDVHIEAVLGEDGTLELDLAAGLYTDRPGSFTLRTTVRDPWRIWDKKELTGVELLVGASGVDTESLRAALEPFLPAGVALTIE